MIEEIANCYSGGTPSRSNPKNYGGAISWVKSGEVDSRDIGSTGESLTEDGLKNSSAKIVPAGSTLIAMYGATAGKVGKLEIDAATNQAVLALVPNALVDHNYLYYAASNATNDLLKKVQGSGQPNLTAGLIRKQKVYLPDLIEQRHIVHILSAWDTAIEKTEKLIEAKEKRFSWLIKSLISDQCRNWEHLQTEKIFKGVSEKKMVAKSCFR